MRELDNAGLPIKASTYNWQARGYDGFMGYGYDEQTGECCEDCICDDTCNSESTTDCIRWTGLKPYRVIYNSADVGLQAGGVRMEARCIPIIECSHPERSGLLNLSERYPYRVMYDTAKEKWRHFYEDVEPCPDILKPCLGEHEYINNTCEIYPPCEGNEDLKTFAPLEYYANEELTSGCSNNDHLNVTIQLLWTGSDYDAGFQPVQPAGVDYRRKTLSSTTPKETIIRIFYRASVSKVKPICSSDGTMGTTPSQACLNDTWLMRGAWRYDPERTEYKQRSCLTNASGCLEGRYSSNSADYWHDITIEMA